MRRTPLHKAIWKPRLLMGCEPWPFLMILTTSLLLVIEGSLWLKVLGVCYFVIFVGLIALLNAKEPFFFQIINRYRANQDFYPNNALHPGRDTKFKNF